MRHIHTNISFKYATKSLYMTKRFLKEEKNEKDKNEKTLKG